MNSLLVLNKQSLRGEVPRYDQQTNSTDIEVAQWSRGMIPALGAGGPGFKSRLSPNFFLYNLCQEKMKYEQKELISEVTVQQIPFLHTVNVPMRKILWKTERMI